MIQTNTTALEVQLAFVKEAAEAFAKNPKLSTFGRVENGGYLAIRWGIMERGIVVVKIDQYEPIINFVDAVKEQ
ncbi:hypothetical protein UFOVP826_37 [uncultured Caudovirales phage]|uniref:Uncharacterized protein n=1 Tax=uncultured Caudovirales phage TaxID=2100421 RepID=A0A6J5NY59_9CAUD|nr:hypothetical protein UFOVP826_37 [uncultured Caudovirales phage]